MVFGEEVVLDFVEEFLDEGRREGLVLGDIAPIHIVFEFADEGLGK